MNKDSAALEAGMLSPRRTAAILATLPEETLIQLGAIKNMSHVKSNIQAPKETIQRYTQEPKKMPTTIADYKALTLAERNWLYENDRARYERLKEQAERGW